MVNNTKEDNLVLSTLKILFNDEIANKVKNGKNYILITLADGTKMQVLTKNYSK